MKKDFFIYKLSINFFTNFITLKKWPREAASKGFQKVADYNNVKEWDGAFNLTARIRFSFQRKK